MEMQGEALIQAPKQVVWDALNDPTVLKEAIPGCEELTQDGEDGFAAKVRAKVGPVSARFAGKVQLSDIDPPNAYRIHGEGSGGAAGFAKGGAFVNLEDDGNGGTLLKYNVEANVGGKLAQIGSRLIDGAARKLADEFFDNFAKIATARAGLPEPENEKGSNERSAEDLEPSMTATSGSEEPSASEKGEDGQTVNKGTGGSKGIPLWIWLSGLAVVLVGLLYVLS